MNEHRSRLITWMPTDGSTETDGVERRCAPDAIQRGLADIPGATVVSATINRAGVFQPPPSPFGPLPPETELPPYCDVQVDLVSEGGHVERIEVWVPLAWNQRFLAVTGGGNRTGQQYFPEFVRAANLPRGARNGFATAASDGGNKDPRFADWGLNIETGELDWDLIRIWSHLATHHTALVGKAVTQAIHGTAPRYSYLQGTSGGGRQTLMSAQRYPEDFDGMWAADPALNYAKLAIGQLWPLVVMKEYGNYLSPAKLSAFRDAAAEALDPAAATDNGVVGVFETWEFDVSQLVGRVTHDGPITETDALVMHRIWDGPRDVDGTRLYGGVVLTTETWGQNVHQTGVAVTVEGGGERLPVPFVISQAMGVWHSGDPAWDWSTLTVENFGAYFNNAAERFGEFGAIDPDLSRLRDSGHKLILSHGVNDEVITPWGPLEYFQDVLREMGGVEATRDYVRFFLAAGDGHSHMTLGPGISLAAGMRALMAWVEDGVAPEVIDGEKFDLSVERITQTQPIYPYPYAPRYTGGGDPLDGSSYEKVLVPERS
ncbi:tannase/feruloyl esterase family alpha/beta hydrolase [Arthrobacter sp. ISL-28]|uniref:tannase/feruloyl esterase family alpha/beta hydrolase n=1 Tax=Arthrobacter sp. ISL-28 TaxID=2819108 RepID=UPI001BE60081|nr:tannase/feruloyl esterase family alpha/beta hydrolase [Arthrobacter sp. ISL-28]MBT2523479.1 tannase/feruloyl esterase family alpha/beta hydrolase [Arthrobacter sp. ISL-28]